MSLPCRIHKTILKKNREGEHKPEDKKVYDDAQGLISERWHRYSMSPKKKIE